VCAWFISWTVLSTLICSTVFGRIKFFILIHMGTKHLPLFVDCLSHPVNLDVCPSSQRHHLDYIDFLWNLATCQDKCLWLQNCPDFSWTSIYIFRIHLSSSVKSHLRTFIEIKLNFKLIWEKLTYLWGQIFQCTNTTYLSVLIAFLNVFQ
jgi:hypothetical protein